MKRSIAFFLCLLPVLLLFPAPGALAGDSSHGGDILYAEPAKGVLFSHATHVEEMGLDCESCHDALFGMEAGAAQAQPDFNMKALYEGRYCGSCHDGRTAFAASTRCASCHIGVKGFDRTMGVEASRSGH